MKTSDYVIDRLEEWGATRIEAREVRDETSIDFESPFPGDQPIKSSITMEDGMVLQATIRYGVLDPDAVTDGRTHPTNDNGALLRLRGAADGPEMPSAGYVVVNYGDTGRQPRPHILYGWTPESDYIDVTELEYLQRAGYNEPTDPEQFMDWIIRAGRRIRQEFRGEWDE